VDPVPETASDSEKPPTSSASSRDRQGGALSISLATEHYFKVGDGQLSRSKMVYVVSAIDRRCSRQRARSQSASKSTAALETLLIHRSRRNIDKIQRCRSAGIGTQANSSKAVKSVAFKVSSDVTSAAQYVAASNVSSTRFRPSR
jgi:hypothetical protein